MAYQRTFDEIAVSACVCSAGLMASSARPIGLQARRPNSNTRTCASSRTARSSRALRSGKEHLCLWAELPHVTSWLSIARSRDSTRWSGGMLLARCTCKISTPIGAPLLTMRRHTIRRTALPQRNATQRNATQRKINAKSTQNQRNATQNQRNATQRKINATQRNATPRLRAPLLLPLWKPTEISL